MSRRLPGLAFLLGLLVLVPPVALLTDQGPFERTPPGSQALYWNEALAAHDDSTLTAAPSTRSGSPYSALLAPLASGNLGAVHRARTIQAGIFLVLFAAAAFLLGRGRAGPWAVAGGLATVLLGPLVISSHNFSPALPAAVILLAALVLLDRSPRWPAWIAAGVLTALAARFFPLLAWPVAGLLLLRAVGSGPSRQRIRVTGGLLAGIAAVSVVAALVVPSPAPVPGIPGHEIYRGHRHGASGVSPRRGDGDLQGWWTFVDYAREASRLRMRPLTPKEAGAFWLARTPAEMVRHPVSELRRTGTKVLATYAGDPLPHEAGASFLREVSDSRVLDILVWAGRILIPLGLWGLVWRRKQAGWVLAVAALSGLVASLITFATPFARLLTLVACGAGFGMWLGAMVRGPSRWRGAAGSVLALGLWGVLPLHGGVPGLGIQGDDYYFLGAVYDQEQRGSAAMREYERSIRMDPLNPFPQIAIASMLARDNVNEEAARQLEQYRALHPDYPPVLFALVHLYQSQQRWLDAANVYGELIRIEPWNPEHLNNLGTVYVQIGYYDQAMRALDSALELDPGYTSARDNRALLLSMGVTDPKGVASPRLDPVERAQEAVLSLMKQGNFPAARDSLEAAYARYGRGRLDLRFLEGTLKLVSGDSEGAVAAYEPIRDRMGKNVIFLFNLGAAYQNLGRLAEAKSAFEAAARIQPTNERVRRSLAEVDAALDSLQTRP